MIPVRSLEPRRSGQLKIRGFQIGYKEFGQPDAPAVLLLPPWQIVHHRHWKMQVPYLSLFFRVILFDAPGNGDSERTTDPAASEFDRLVAYGFGVLDHLNINQTSLVGFSRGCSFGLGMAAHTPERISRLVTISYAPPHYDKADFWDPRRSYQGWEKRNVHYWRNHYRDFLDFFFAQMFIEPHSTKQIDDGIGWAEATTPDILANTTNLPSLKPKLPLDDIIAAVSCPVLIIHGTDDQQSSSTHSQNLAKVRPDWEFVTLEGSGHAPHLRDPVKINMEIAQFLGVPQPKRRTWRRSMSRRTPKALFVCSPIGLGHAQRDIAIANELRRLAPELHIEWLAQHPVTKVLEANGEIIHPLSELLVSESAHWERSAGEHQLHCFYAWRNMDEILLANFMVFLEAVRETPYDVWIGDEAWEVDYYLHENPAIKTAPYVFLTDFLGWLPIDRTPGSRDVFLTTDYNAEMIEHIARYPRVRDRAIYIGDYDDLIPELFGAGLPLIPDGTREHFEAVGYITPFDPADYADTQAVRDRLGYASDEALVFLTIGGTDIGEFMLRKAIDAWPLIHQARPDARCIAVAGPRLAPERLPRHPGLEIRPYLHNLYEHLAVADLAVVQGGLGTTMELVANRRPFIYFPLKDHCEQVYHVAYRLDHYRAGRRLNYHQTGVEALAEAALTTLGADTGGYRPYDPGGATRAAKLIAELL